MTKLSPNWKTTEPFSGTLALAVQEFPTLELEKKLGEYRALYPKTTPALETAKAVWLALALRSFAKPEFDYTVCANETIEQLASHLGLDRTRARFGGKDAISNALRFLEWAGYVRTLRKGGGKLKRPTVREVIPSALSKREVTRSESERLGDQNGKELELDGKSGELNGEKAELDGNETVHDGSEPATPSTYQALTKHLPRINHEPKNEVSDGRNEKEWALEQARKLGKRA
jgi:hypothetical protein